MLLLILKIKWKDILCWINKKAEIYSTNNKALIKRRLTRIDLPIHFLNMSQILKILAKKK